MKQFYFFLLAIALSGFSHAQTAGASTVYGYRQQVMPGIIRAGIDGKETPRKPQYNYFIYLACASKLTPVEIWIDGEPYSVSAATVSSPVKYTNPTSGDITPQILVPKTTKKLVQLNPVNTLQKPSQKGRTLSAKNKLVIIYRSNGKLYYKTLSNFSEIQPVVMQ